MSKNRLKMRLSKVASKLKFRNKNRTIGILDGRAKAIFHKDLKITEDQFLGLE